MENQERTARIALGKRGALLLIYAFTAAFGYCFFHQALIFRLTEYAWHLPGIGLCITQLLGMALVLTLGRKQLRHTAGGWMCVIVSVLLSLNFALHSNNTLRFFNVPVLFVTSALGLFSLLGVMQHDPLTAAGFREGLLRLLPAPFRHMDVPFKAIRFDKKNAALRGAGLGLLLCVPVAALVIVLLSSADVMFSGMLEGWVRWTENLNNTVLWHLIRALVLALGIFSLCYALFAQGKEIAPAKARSAQGSVFITMLGVLSLVYALFAWVQLRYLFAGAGGMGPDDYARYARSGFFQLVRVALINVALVWTAIALCKNSRAVRVMSMLVTALTGVILFSAWWRIQRYIDVFGLSLLRVLTLWAMAMILLSLILTLVKCVKPGFALWRVLSVCVLCTWTMLNLCNADGLIARHNVRAYNEGRIEQLDTWYLLTLTPDAQNALAEIEDEELRRSTLQAAAEDWDAQRPAPYDRSLFWYLVP